MFVGSIYSYFTFTPNYFLVTDPEAFNDIQRARLRMPIVHFVLMVFNMITGNPRFAQQGVK
jgi:hypothetical protein